MKKIIFALILCVCCLNAIAQKATNQAKNKKVYYVTETMCVKIACNCLYDLCYTCGTFYNSNKEILTASDIIKGKGREILYSLDKYPEYAENFICYVYNHWDYKGLKRIGFNDEEIEISYKIINNKSTEL